MSASINDNRRARRAKSDRLDATALVGLFLRQLLALRGIGEVSAWLYTTDFFGWRAFHNRRQLAGLADLTPTTRSSGDVEREQGISKAGNVLIRSLAIELARSWVRRQPSSASSQWYRARFAAGCSH